MYMMVGIIAIIGFSQVNRIIGGILGIAFWIGVGFVGNTAYDRGGAIGFPGLKFSREVFFVICAVFAMISGYTAIRAYVRSTQR